MTLPKVPCPSCGRPKAAVAAACWECHVEAKRVLALSPEERRRRNAARVKARRDADPERARREAREQYQTHGRKHWLKWKFGITPEQWDEMFAAQAGCCYLCDEPLGKNVHIDHDRSCCRGVQSCGTCIRGLACQLCNQGIGQFGDDPERMRRVADNLEMANRRLRDSALRGPSAGSNAPAGREATT